MRECISLLLLTFLREEQMDEKDDSSESEEGTIFSFFYPLRGVSAR